MKVSFRDVTEHDIDLLLMEEFAVSQEFLQIFLSRIGIGHAKVLSLESSKTDLLLGESDITVVVEEKDGKTGILIEDKIDAIAMPDQAVRYSKRGEKGIETGEYDRFFVFIVAPEEYLRTNTEAGKYPHSVSYEEVLAHFKESDDPGSIFKRQQLEQAIYKQKKGYQVVEDEAVTVFWKNYAAFQKEFFPDLTLVYDGKEKGGKSHWYRFPTIIDGLFIIHKSLTGMVDLTFNGCGENISEIERIMEHSVSDFYSEGFSIRKTGKSAAVRLVVPELNLHEPFEEQIENARTCFLGIRKMNELVKGVGGNTIRNLISKALN